MVADLGGYDKLSGARGQRVICGGKGKDTLKGGKGKDTVKGAPGKKQAGPVMTPPPLARNDLYSHVEE